MIGVERRHPALWAMAEQDRPVEPREDFLLRHPHRLAGLQRLVLGLALRTQLLGRGIVERHQQCRRRQLAAPVDANVNVVFGVEFEVEPRAAVRDHPGSEQIFPRGMGLTLIVIEEHAWAAVHLRNDDPFSAVDNEGPVLRHQRHIAHIDVLLLDVADRARAGILVYVPDHKAQRNLKGSGKGNPALLAFADIVFRSFKLVTDEFQLGTL